MSDTAALRPTHVRYLIVFVAMAAAVLLYLERVCLSVADVYVREDLKIGKSDMNAAFAAFFLAYALGQVPSGWLSQRYGPRLMMFLYMVGWSVFGVFIALAQDFVTLFVARFLLGLSQAGAYPTAALVVKRWVPDRHRGLASSIVAFGGRFGGAGATWLTGLLIVAFVPTGRSNLVSESEILNVAAIAAPSESQRASEQKLAALEPVRSSIRGQLPSNATPMAVCDVANDFLRSPTALDGVDLDAIPFAVDGKAIAAKPAALRTEADRERLHRLALEIAFPGAIRQLHTDGWRPTLILYGVLGILVGGAFWVVARDFPRLHPWANAAEIELIESGQRKVEEADSDAVPFRPLLASRNQWFFSANQFCSNFGWVFVITLMPRFLETRFGVPIDERGKMNTIAMLIAALAIVPGGWFTDVLTRRVGRRWGRSVPLGLFKLPCVIALVATADAPTAWAAVAWLTVMAACQDFGVPSAWAFAQDTAGKQVGAVLGWANMWGNFGAGVALLTTGPLEAIGGWNAVLYTGAAAFAFCGTFGLLSDASVPLFGKRDE